MVLNYVTNSCDGYSDVHFIFLPSSSSPVRCGQADGVSSMRALPSVVEDFCHFLRTQRILEIVLVITYLSRCR